MVDQAGHGESEGPGATEPPSFPGNAPPPPPGPPSYPAGGQPGSPPSFPGPAPTATGGGFPPPGPFDTTSGVPYATWAVRLGGWLIDFVIFLVPYAIFAILLRHNHSLDVHLMARKGSHMRRSISALPFLLTGALYVVYGTLLCGGRRGQTVGMMAVGVGAVRDEPTHGRLGYGRALVRALFEQVLRLLELVSLVLGLVWLLDMLFPLWDRKRQTLHDKAAGSVVLRLRPGG